MDDTRITELEDRIARIEAQRHELALELANARLDSWEARVEDLDLQAHLAGMELRERLAPLVDRARNVVLDARASVRVESMEQASTAIELLRDGLDLAYVDLVEAFRSARAELVG